MQRFFTTIVFLSTAITVHAGGPGSGRHKEGGGSDSGEGMLFLFLIILVFLIIALISIIIGKIHRAVKLKKARKEYITHAHTLLEKKELTYDQLAMISKNIEANGVVWAKAYVQEIATKREREIQKAELIREGDALAASGAIDKTAWETFKPEVDPLNLARTKRKLDDMQEALQRKNAIDSFLAENSALSAKGIIFAAHWEEIRSGVAEQGVPWAIRVLEVAKEIKQRYDGLITKYGQEKGNKIYNKEFFLGMTEEELIDSVGVADKVEEEVMKTKTKITWIYGNKSSGDVFVFENGMLARFKDR
jgi:hypothetical protein